MSVVREVGIAWRGLRRNTGLTLVVVLMLATAIAATTTIFAIFGAVATLLFIACANAAGLLPLAPISTPIGSESEKATMQLLR